MDYTRDARELRIQLTLERHVEPFIYPKTIPLEVERAVVGGEPISYEEAEERTFSPVAEGAEWGAQWDTCWFRMRGQVPADWAGKQVVGLVDLSFDAAEGFGREGLVWMDGKPVAAVNRNRAAIALCESAESAESIEFYVEAAANPEVPFHWNAESYQPEYGGEPTYRLKKARLAVFDPEAYALRMDFTCCQQAMAELADNSPRRIRLFSALDAAVACLVDGRAQGIARAREALAEVMAETNASGAHEVYAVGHAHIDTAWLWPLRETIRKCARSFVSVLRYMDVYPDFHFTCSQPQQYLWMKRYYPSIYEGIQEAVSRGQWEVTGSMWVEADCNVPCGESLIRQILHGKNFFMEAFGVETTDLWLPDVFGYPGHLPQLLRESGIDVFMTQKLSWNDSDRFPHNTFRWHGLDDTQVLVHCPPVDSYNAQMTAKELMRSERTFAESAVSNCTLIPYGHGDGGGGPTIEHIEMARRWRDFQGMPKVAMSTAGAFFEKIAESADSLPVWRGELYFQKHRGTLTSQAHNKKMNRRCERLLRDAELLQAIAYSTSPARLLREDPVPDREVWDVPGFVAEKKGVLADEVMDRAWKLMLLNQFHDIIPGSSIQWVYQDSAKDYQTIVTIAEAVIEAVLSRLAAGANCVGVDTPVLVFNTLAKDRRELVELPSGRLEFVDAPACGYTVVTDAEGLVSDLPSCPVSMARTNNGVALENGLLRVLIDGDGFVSSIMDLEHGREVLRQGEGGVRLELFADQPNHWDAWDVDAIYERLDGAIECMGIEKLVHSPQRCGVRLEFRIGQSSSAVQTFMLDTDSRRLEVSLSVDWQEDHRLLQVAFPLDLNCRQASYDAQFGFVTRPTHGNTSWDAAQFQVPAQQWADMSEGDYGVAVLNDGKYAYDAQNNVMSLTLLRAPRCPDPDCDRGKHDMRYAIYPHAGGVAAGNVVEEARRFNSPVLLKPVITAAAGFLPREQSFLRICRPGTFLAALKKAEKSDALVMRFYEAHNTRGVAVVESTLFGESVQDADMLERPRENLDAADQRLAVTLRPFQVQTVVTSIERESKRG